MGNLEVLLKELRKLSDLSGARLNYLVVKCGVSTRQIYRYLNDLHKLGYEILRNIHQDTDSLTGYSVSVVAQEQTSDLPQINLFSELEHLKEEIYSARLFIMDLIRQLRMDKVGVATPLTVPILNYCQEDAISASRHSLVLSDCID